MVDYRLAPENVYPAQLDDALYAYKELLKTTAPDKIVMVGNSVGGNLACALMLKLKELKLPQPKLCVLLST